MKKIVLFAFNGDFMCFIHVLLNALDMNEKGHEVKIVIEGSATKLIPELKKKGNPMYALFQKAPDFEAPAYQDGKFGQVKLSDYFGKWIVLCFYPGDFTFV